MIKDVLDGGGGGEWQVEELEHDNGWWTSPMTLIDFAILAGVLLAILVLGHSCGR